MAGKRPRQIQRTTSMSQLGGSIRFSHGLNANAGAPLRGHSCPPKQEFCHTSTDPCPEAVEVAALPLDIEEHVSSMVIDGSARERPSSRKICSGSVTGPSSHRATVLGAEALGSLGTHEGGLSTHPRGKDCQISHLRRARLDAGGSVRPAHFLDVCYFCSKLLGHGRDVFIYRGDKAFCSVECRHLQILADERREKGALTGASDVSANTTQMSDASNANHVETVAAA